MARQVSVDVLDRLLDECWHVTVRLRNFGLVQGDQGCQVGAAVTNDERLRDVAGGLERTLDVLGGDVLAARGDDDVLLAVGDRHEAVLVDLADVAGAEPAVVRQHGLRCLFVLEIPREDRLATNQ